MRISDMLKDTASKISDVVFFMSDIFVSWATDFCNLLLMSRGIKKRVKVICYKSEDPNENASTNGDVVRVNVTGNLIMSHSLRPERSMAFRGLLLHEIGHVIYTDFETIDLILNNLYQRRVIYMPIGIKEMNDAIAEVRTFVAGLQNPKLLEVVCKLSGEILNVLEDPYVNARVMEEYPGHAYCVEDIMEQTYAVKYSLIELIQLEKENKLDPFISMIELIHTYAMYAEFKCESWQSNDPHIVMLSELQDYIDASLQTHDRKLRTFYQFGVFALLLPYFKAYMERMIEKYGNDAPEQMSKAIDEATKSFGDEKTCEKVLEGAKNGRPVQRRNVAEADKVDAETKEKMAKNAAPTEDTSADTGGGSSDDMDDVEVEASPDESLRESAMEKEGTPSPAGKREPFSVSREERKREKPAAMDKETKAMDGLLKKMAEAAIKEKSERERTAAMSRQAQAIEHAAIHNGQSMKIIRTSSVNPLDKEKWREYVAESRNRADSYALQVKNILEKRRKGDVQHNLMLGRRLEFRALIRHDGKAMSRRKLPSNYPTVAVAVCADMSGSTRGNRITAERVASLILYQFCRTLKFKCAVYGFNTSSATTYLHAFAEFESIDGDDEYRIMEMEAGHSNRDGYALRYVAERLYAQKADLKLLFMISDGQPAASGYSGRTACEDIASVVKEYARKKVITIACAIGDDKYCIESIYGRDNFLDITDLDTLPKVLTDVVRAAAKL